MIALLLGKSGWLTSVIVLYLYCNHTKKTPISVQKQLWLQFYVKNWLADFYNRIASALQPYYDDDLCTQRIMIALLFGKSGWLTSIIVLHVYYNHTTTTTISLHKQSCALFFGKSGWLTSVIVLCFYANFTTMTTISVQKHSCHWGITPILQRTRRMLHVLLRASSEAIYKTLLLD